MDFRKSFQVPIEITEEALLTASEYGTLEEVEYLVTNGVNVNCKNRKHDRMPLHVSARYGQLKVMKYLLQQGADVDCKNRFHNFMHEKRGDTLLHEAADGGHLEVVKYLHENMGADIHCKNNHGETPLHLSAERGRLEVVQYLVQQGADIECKDSNGWTPLHYSAYECHLEIVKYLIQQGADKTVRSKFDKTAYDCFRWRDPRDISEEVKESMKELLQEDTMSYVMK